MKIENGFSRFSGISNKNSNDISKLSKKVNLNKIKAEEDSESSISQLKNMESALNKELIFLQKKREISTNSYGKFSSDVMEKFEDLNSEDFEKYNGFIKEKMENLQWNGVELFDKSEVELFSVQSDEDFDSLEIKDTAIKNFLDDLGVRIKNREDSLVEIGVAEENIAAMKNIEEIDTIDKARELVDQLSVSGKSAINNLHSNFDISVFSKLLGY